METETTQELDGLNGICCDCMRDRDSCPDCCNGDLYLSPDEYEVNYDR
jgi:hypothetical protein